MPLRMLVNESVQLPNGVVLAGVGDQAAKAFFRNKPELALKYGDMSGAALKNTPAEKFVLLLAHRPKVAEEASKMGADLQLSGHTHGGMIRGFDLLVGLYQKGWISGRYQVGNMTLLVSNGTWLWKGFPLRLGRPGEILLVTLKKQK
jgi:predicted MPP superfamily phosphohydrolase